jgi:hypothetical protein
VLTFASDVVEISQNNIRGNSDVGMLIFSDFGVFDNNKVFDEGEDHPDSCCDVGFWNIGDNEVTNNKIRGFEDPILDVIDGNNKVIPSPQS